MREEEPAPAEDPRDVSKVLADAEPYGDDLKAERRALEEHRHGLLRSVRISLKRLTRSDELDPRFTRCVTAQHSS